MFLNCISRCLASVLDCEPDSRNTLASPVHLERGLRPDDLDSRHVLHRLVSLVFQLAHVHEELSDAWLRDFEERAERAIEPLLPDSIPLPMRVSGEEPDFSGISEEVVIHRRLAGEPAIEEFHALLVEGSGDRRVRSSEHLLHRILRLVQVHEEWFQRPRAALRHPHFLAALSEGRHVERILGIPVGMLEVVLIEVGDTEEVRGELARHVLRKEAEPLFDLARREVRGARGADTGPDVSVPVGGVVALAMKLSQDSAHEASPYGAAIEDHHSFRLFQNLAPFS